jgi:hypothetical protein
MNTYYQLPDEKKKQMYLDAEPHLTLSYCKVEKNLKVLSAKIFIQKRNSIIC